MSASGVLLTLRKMFSAIALHVVVFNQIYAVPIFTDLLGHLVMDDQIELSGRSDRISAVLATRGSHVARGTFSCFKLSVRLVDNDTVTSGMLGVIHGLVRGLE